MLSPEQVKQLRYPHAEPAAGGTGAFGQVALSADGNAIIVQLAWDGEGMILVRTDELEQAE